MASEEGKYNIKAISTMLGIQPGTLRAWERRYRIIEPIRNHAGHRLYSDEHVSILRWLIDKVNKGFTIGQAVGLYEKGNVTLQTKGIEQEDHSIRLSDEILSALLSFEENKANQLLSQAFCLFTVEKVTIDILGTLLMKVREMWENEQISFAHEHFATAFLRTKIGTVFYGFPVDGHLPKVLAVCGPNETHELGLLMYTLFLRQKGFEVIHLGAGIPNDDVELVLREMNAKMFFTSCTMKENLDMTLQLLDRLNEKFPTLLIGAGGFAFDDLAEPFKKRCQKYLVGQSKLEWEHWIKEHFRIF